MMRILQKISIALAAIFLVATTTSGGAMALGSYDPLNEVCSGENAKTSVCQQDAAQKGSTTNPVVTTIAKTAKVISLIVGFASIILIVVSGLNMITSGGNPEGIKSARSRMTSAIIGLVIAALAWVLASFIIGALL